MTSQIITKALELSDGYEFYPNSLIVKSSGKFEGESIATLYYYDCFLNGDGVIFKVSEDERKAFDIGEGYKYVYLYESDLGFVHLYFCTSQEEAEAMETEDSSSKDEYQSDPDDFQE